MDHDRRSAVSSFYGGRRSSVDALNSEYPMQPSSSSPRYDTTQFGERARRDSSSTFFNPARDPTPGSAGYNRQSYFDVGRVEPVKGGRDEEETLGSKTDGWDVYADFNNAGPKYSTIGSLGSSNGGYQPVGSPAVKHDDEVSTLAAAEMITVPALGPEWKQSELRDMTKAGRQEDRNYSRKRKWREWKRGNEGCFGGWFTRKVFTFVLFFVCAAVGLTVYFALPRVPDFSFNSTTPLGNATGSFAQTIPTIFSRAPANFSFPAFAELQVNTNSEFIPLHLSKIDAEIYDVNSGRLIGTGSMGGMKFPANKFTNIQLPLNFTYIATNDSDPTWLNWYNACKNTALYANGERPGVDFTLLLNMDIEGLIGTKHASTKVTNADCPVELSPTAA